MEQKNPPKQVFLLQPLPSSPNIPADRSPASQAQLTPSSPDPSQITPRDPDNPHDSSQSTGRFAQGFPPGQVAPSEEHLYAGHLGEVTPKGWDSFVRKPSIIIVILNNLEVKISVFFHSEA